MTKDPSRLETLELIFVFDMEIYKYAHITLILRFQTKVTLNFNFEVLSGLYNLQWILFYVISSVWFLSTEFYRACLVLDTGECLIFLRLIFQWCLFFQRFWRCWFFLAAMLNFPTIFEFGQNIQKIFDKFLDVRSKITHFIWNQVSYRLIYYQNCGVFFEK